MRRAVLDAARATAAESGWDAVSLNTVAVRAQVSRPSVYKEFHSRHGLAEALAQEDAASFLAEVAAVLESPAASPGASLAASVDRVLDMARANPLVASIVHAAGNGTDGLLPYLTSRPEPVVGTARRLLANWFRARFPDSSAAACGAAADVTVRLTISLILLPSPGADPAPGRTVAAAALGALGHEDSARI
ncbi:TetR/AcrR family transcriptional regulator [Streptomyces zhihengii]